MIAGERLKAVADQLKQWIRDRQTGGCRMLLVADACECPLCRVDALLSAALASSVEASPEEGRPNPPNMADAAEMLWIVTANVSGGDWMKQSPEWREAAARWRDYYFQALSAEAQGDASRASQEPT